MSGVSIPRSAWDDPEPTPNRLVIEANRWVIDGKVRALAALCQFQSTGKGDDRTRAAIHELANQFVALKAAGKDGAA